VALALAAVLLLALAGLGLRASHRDLRTASRTDELTGLPNRRALTERLDLALQAGQRHGTATAVLLVDLDRFKQVNDTLGHHHGDVLLRAVAGRLGAAFRPEDVVARLGGDEFAVLLPDVHDAATAERLARECLDALLEPLVLDDLTLAVEASVGLALAPDDGEDRHALLRAADIAMYEAKHHGQGLARYDRAMDVNTPMRLALLGDLRRALHSRELYLEYQPKVDLPTGAVRSVEALVRWRHPERGIVPPLEFVPAAEDSGLILPLTLYTLREAAAQARVWLDAGTDLQVAVNLSPRCLVEPELPRLVREVLADHGVPSALLRLEVTESTIMVDPARALAVLAELRASGIALSIDDFGTGYSSMSYLQRLPVDELKIDRSFVAELVAGRGDEVLVRSSIELGHDLGLRVVAEGVEDESTLAALADLGCDVVQGYHLARPMAATAVTEWLQARAADEVPRPQAGDHVVGVGGQANRPTV
jgi:diguanylate cyclase (GGDEF)-like protein